MTVRENANKKVCERVWPKEQWIRSRCSRENGIEEPLLLHQLVICLIPVARLHYVININYRYLAFFLI